jgi:IS30 family transposase
MSRFDFSDFWYTPRELWTRRSRDEVLDAWFHFTKLNWTCRMIANELNMRPDTLDRAITRARKRGDKRAIKRDIIPGTGQWKYTKRSTS